MALDLVAVMRALHTIDVQSYISLTKFELPGVSDMITALREVWDHFSFVFCRIFYECMLSPFLCHIPAGQNALITVYFHSWDANTPVCSTPSYGLQETERVE